MVNPMIRLMELDARHNELLDRLSELDREVEGVLNDWTATKGLIGDPLQEVLPETAESNSSVEKKVA